MTREQITAQTQEQYPHLMAELQQFIHSAGEQDSSYIGENNNLFYVYRNGDVYNLKKAK